MLTHALAYAARGWRVFPLSGKVPAIPGGHGCLDATTDEATIRAWWREYPGAGIGLACGPESGFWVLDVDTDHGGLVSLERLEQGHPDRPATRVARTGRGGLHFYWRIPDGRKIKNRVGSLKLPDGTQLPGLDTRSAGGYVVAPPSPHPDTGKAYSWAADGDPEPAPDWLLEIVAERPRPAAPRPVQRVTLPPGSDSHPYALRALENACERIAHTPEGGRNGTLYREAYTMGGFVGAGALSRLQSADALLQAGQACGLPHQEVADVVARGLDVGALAPTPIPEDTRPRLAPSRPISGPRPVALDEVAPAPEPDDPGPEDPGEAEPGEDVAPEVKEATDGEDWADLVGEHLTDLGNAKRLVRLFGANLHHCPSIPGGWLVWNGTCWTPDESGKVARYAKCLSSILDQEADEIEHREGGTEEEKAKIADAVRKWARKTESANAIRNALELVRSEHGVHVAKAKLDADPWLLGYPNGTADLRTGALRPHRRCDLLTRSISVNYDPDASCPTWDRFLDEVMLGDVELVRYLQRCVGYSLCGTIQEQIFIVLHGTGQNGKSTFVGTLRALLGSYGSTLNAKAFLSADSTGVPNDIAALDGARFVIASEAREGAPLDEALVKAVTGGEPISARFMRQEWFEFTPAFQVWYSSNHRPIIRGTDHGIWRRMRLIPWNYTVPPDRDDKFLGAKLLDEGPGILAWAVRGALAWQADGLGTPEAVLQATKEYRSEMDLLADFLADCCNVGPLASGVENTDLFRAFVKWSQDNGERERSHKWLSRQLRDRGFQQKRASGRTWDGIALNFAGQAYVNPTGGYAPHRGYEA